MGILAEARAVIGLLVEFFDVLDSLADFAIVDFVDAALILELFT